MWASYRTQQERGFEWDIKSINCTAKIASAGTAFRRPAIIPNVTGVLIEGWRIAAAVSRTATPMVVANTSAQNTLDTAKRKALRSSVNDALLDKIRSQ